MPRGTIMCRLHIQRRAELRTAYGHGRALRAPPPNASTSRNSLACTFAIPLRRHYCDTIAAREKSYGNLVLSCLVTLLHFFTINNGNPGRAETWSGNRPHWKYPWKYPGRRPIVGGFDRTRLGQNDQRHIRPIETPYDRTSIGVFPGLFPIPQFARGGYFQWVFPLHVSG